MTRKRYLLIKFNRETLHAQVDGNPWTAVRCVRVTYGGDEVIQAGSLSDLLKQRLSMYMDDMGMSDSEDAGENAEENADVEDADLCLESEGHGV